MSIDEEVGEVYHNVPRALISPQTNLYRVRGPRELPESLLGVLTGINNACDPSSVQSLIYHFYI